MHRPSWWVYRAVRDLLWLFYPHPVLEGSENLPDEPTIIVGNHAQMNGPIVAEIFIPGDHAIWCRSEMMHLKEVPDYAFQDFWSKKPASVRWIYRLLSYVIAPLSVCIFNNASCIGVYTDARLRITIRETIQKLSEGARIVIFPEHEVPCNNIVYEFQDRFIDVARFYHHQTGKILCFVPMYVCPALHKVIFGQPVRYNPDGNPDAERRRVCQALMNAVTDIARAQPRHRVVPYPNFPRRIYPYNISDEETRR